MQSESSGERFKSRILVIVLLFKVIWTQSGVLCIRLPRSKTGHSQGHIGGYVHNTPTMTYMPHRSYQVTKPSFSYEYGVSDDCTGDMKAVYETREGDFLQGGYQFLQPDGILRVVTYTSDPWNGFQTKVQMLNGHSHHPIPGHLQQTHHLIPGTFQQTHSLIPGHFQQTRHPIPGDIQQTHRPIPGHFQQTHHPIPGQFQQTHSIPGHFQQTHHPIPGQFQQTHQPIPGHFQQTQLALPSNNYPTFHRHQQIMPNTSNQFVPIIPPQLLSSPTRAAEEVSSPLKPIVKTKKYKAVRRFTISKSKGQEHKHNL